MESAIGGGIGKDTWSTQWMLTRVGVFTDISESDVRLIGNMGGNARF